MVTGFVAGTRASNKAVKNDIVDNLSIIPDGAFVWLLVIILARSCNSAVVRAFTNAI